MKKFFVITLMIVVFMLISTAQAAYTVNRFPVYESLDNQANPDIDGDIVVWQGGDGNLYYRYLDGPTQPTALASAGTQTGPKVSGNIVVWYDYDTYRNVYGYHLQEDQFLYIADDAAKQWQPDISSSIVVWEEAGDIKLYDIDQDLYQVVCDDSASQYRPAVDGNTVVWMDARHGSGNYQIYRSDISGEPPYADVRVGTSGNAQWDPDIGGDWIVWEEKVGPNQNIAVVAYNKQTAAIWSHTIVSGTAINAYPRVSNGIVVWQDQTDGSVWAKDLIDWNSLAFEVSDGTGTNQRPAVFVDPVSGKKTLVWDHNSDIYAAELQDYSAVEMTYPNGGELFTVGDSMPITWTRSGASPAVLVEFSSDGGSNWISLDTVSDANSYTWDAANVDSTDCLIRVTNTKYTNIKDTSDAAFEIHPVSDAIEVLSPDGGEMILAGSEMLITWGLVSGNAPAAVDITFDDATHDPNVIAVDIPFTDYQYLWTPVADINSIDACYIQISDAADGDPVDASDGAFSVFQCDAKLTADLTGDCYVNMNDFAALALQWLTCGNPHDPAWCDNQ